MAQVYDERKKAWNRKWDAANLDRLSVAVPRGYKERLQARGAETGETVNALIRRLIEAELYQCNG